jgi:hypothetical protein
MYPPVPPGEPNITAGLCRRHRDEVIPMTGQEIHNLIKQGDYTTTRNPNTHTIHIIPIKIKSSPSTKKHEQPVCMIHKLGPHNCRYFMAFNDM